MKTALACVLVALCALQVVHGDSLPALQSQLRRLKNEVGRTIREMQRYENTVKRDLKNNVSNSKYNYMKQMNEITNPAWNEVNEKVEAAKAEGKDANHCREEARRTHTNVRNEAYATLDACEANAVQVLDPVLNSAEVIIQNGQKLSNELDSIPLKCYSNNPLQMQNCIALSLGSANPAVKALSSSAESVKTNGQIAVNRGTAQADSCYRPILHDLRMGMYDMKTAAEKCIRNA